MMSNKPGIEYPYNIWSIRVAEQAMISPWKGYNTLFPGSYSTEKCLCTAASCYIISPTQEH